MKKCTFQNVWKNFMFIFILLSILFFNLIYSVFCERKMLNKILRFLSQIPLKCLIPLDCLVPNTDTENLIYLLFQVSNIQKGVVKILKYFYNFLITNNFKSIILIIFDYYCTILQKIIIKLNQEKTTIYYSSKTTSSRVFFSPVNFDAQYI